MIFLEYIFTLVASIYTELWILQHMGNHTLLTSRNKSKLSPLNSPPGVYMTVCDCGKKYFGETSMKTATRIKQHKKSIVDNKWDLTWVIDQNLQGGIRLGRDNCFKNRRKKIWKESAWSIGNPAPANVATWWSWPESGRYGQYVTTNLWKPMFTHIREKTLQWFRFISFLSWWRSKQV